MLRILSQHKAPVKIQGGVKLHYNYVVCVCVCMVCTCTLYIHVCVHV